MNVVDFAGQRSLQRPDRAAHVGNQGEDRASRTREPREAPDYARCILEMLDQPKRKHDVVAGFGEGIEGPQVSAKDFAGDALALQDTPRFVAADRGVIESGNAQPEMRGEVGKQL